MTQSTTERNFVFAFRMLMAWTFLYAASHQEGDNQCDSLEHGAVWPKLSPGVTS